MKRIGKRLVGLDAGRGVWCRVVPRVSAGQQDAGRNRAGV